MARLSKKPALREPIQVYLTKPDRALLDRVAAKAGLSRAEVLRRGLKRIGAELLAEENPVLRFLEEMAKIEWRPDAPTDVSRRTDEYLGAIALDRYERERP